MRYLVYLIAAIAVSACTSVDVRPVDPSLNVQHVCIQENRKVTLDGFLPMLEEGFARHGISTQVIPDTRTCEYTLTYTALRSWDITVYLSHAELHLLHQGQEIATAEFHLNGKGGFAPTKFKGTRSKMDPVIDQLLAGYDLDAGDRIYNGMTVVENVESTDTASDEAVFSRDIYAELRQLDELRKQGIITDEEFEQEKRELLDKN